MNIYFLMGLIIPERAGSMVVVAEADKTQGGKVDWKTVRGLMVDAIYGGRVDNPHDTRVLETYLRRYFNSEVVRIFLFMSVQVEELSYWFAVLLF